MDDWNIEAFDRFWAVYPRHVAKSAARQAWKRIPLKEQDEDAILTALQTQIAIAWRDRTPEFVPHAATWIRGKRWDDELQPMPRAKLYDWTCPHEAPKCRARGTCATREVLEQGRKARTA